VEDEEERKKKHQEEHTGVELLNSRAAAALCFRQHPVKVSTLQGMAPIV